MAKISDYKRLKEIEENYNIKADTLRAYINRKEVIPEDKYKKKYGIWFIDDDWIKKKYEKRK